LISKKYWVLAFITGFVILGSLISGLITFAQEESTYYREIRSIYVSEQGIFNPTGLAYFPSKNALMVLEDQRPSGISLISLFNERLEGNFGLSTPVSDPTSFSFNERTKSIYFFDQSTHELIQIQANSPEQLSDPEAVTRFDMMPVDIEQARGITFDPNNGSLIILDAGRSEIVKIEPGSQNQFDGESAVREGRVQKSKMGSSVSGQPKGIAYNPNNNHIYILSPERRYVYEMSPEGQVLATIDLTKLALSDPQAITFAPSGDPTDDPEIMNLFIADRINPGGQLISAADSQSSWEGQILELSLLEPVQIDYSALMMESSLVNEIDASAWSPPSPDTAGIVYSESSGRLLVSDSEVNEMTIYAGVNFFETTLSGGVLETANTLSFSDEPTGLGINPQNGHIFVSDDWQGLYVYEVDLGPDGNMGTGDDTVTFFDTETFNGSDPEGVAYAQGKLFVIDGLGEEVYIIDAFCY
jgi:DNA-binding beta-propeller fold protein YncE